jgi:hypothetical protein
VSNRSCLFDGACLPKWFRFLPPLAPRALPRFHATMAALTSARTRSCGFLPAQLSTVRHDNFHTYPAQPPTTIRFLTFDESCRSVRSWLAPQASPLASWLAIVEGRIGFTCVRVCAFASGCSPPRLTATQLPLTSLPWLASEGLRLSLVVLMVTSFALAAPLCWGVGWGEVAVRSDEHGSRVPWLQRTRSPGPGAAAPRVGIRAWQKTRLLFFVIFMRH